MAEIYFSCDWGTSHFRLRAVRWADLAVVDQVVSGDGVAQLAPADDSTRPERYRQVLASALVSLAERLGPAAREAPCVISGMASSSVGWLELPYARTPQRLDGTGLTVVALDSIEAPLGPHPLHLVSGLRTETDVMRGEETQILGLFQLDRSAPWAERSLVVMPGTHSKHVLVDKGAIASFRTFMTGELFDVLSHHSLLRHSVSVDPQSQQRDAAAFDEGVLASRDQALASALFRVRTRQVLDGRPGPENRDYLSGLLIGSEYTELARREPADIPIVLAAAEALAARYVEAARLLNLADRLQVVGGAEVDRLASLGHACLLNGRGIR